MYLQIYIILNAHTDVLCYLHSIVVDSSCSGSIKDMNVMYEIYLAYSV